MSKLVEVNKKIEDTVVGGYKKIEEGAVGGFQKMTDKFVGSFLTKEGESVEEAKERLAKEQAERAKKAKEEAENRTKAQEEMIQKSLEMSRGAGTKIENK